MRPFLSNNTNNLGFDAANNEIIGSAGGINGSMDRSGGFDSNSDLFDPFPIPPKTNVGAPSLFSYEQERDLYGLGGKQVSHSHHYPPPASHYIAEREQRGVFPPRDAFRSDLYNRERERERERDLFMLYGREKDARDRDLYSPAAPRPYINPSYNRYDNLTLNNSSPAVFNSHFRGDTLRDNLPLPPHSHHGHLPPYSQQPPHHLHNQQQQQQQQQHNMSMSHSRHAPGSIALAKGALFVGDLSFFTSEADLRRLFAPFGKLKRAEVKRGRFGDSLMHGFVELDVLAGAQRAMQELDGIKFMGRRIRVHWAYSNAEKSSPKDRESWTQLHVTFTSPRIDILLSEDILDRLFSRFGEVADVTVKKHSRILEPQSFQSGYAFIYYYETTPAIEAAERFKNTVVADVHFETSLSFRSQRIVENSLVANKAAAAAATQQQQQQQMVSLASGQQLEALLFSDLTTSVVPPTVNSNSVSLSSLMDHSGNINSIIASLNNYNTTTTTNNNNSNTINNINMNTNNNNNHVNNKWILDNNENFSVVSESAQTQLTEFDRETMLFSQQTSDSSLYLYGHEGHNIGDNNNNNNSDNNNNDNNNNTNNNRNNNNNVLSKAVSILTAPSRDMDSFTRQLSVISQKLDKTQLTSDNDPDFVDSGLSEIK